MSDTTRSRFWTLRVPSSMPLPGGSTMRGFTFTDPLTAAEARAAIQARVPLSDAAMARCRIFASPC